MNYENSLMVILVFYSSESINGSDLPNGILVGGLKTL